MKIQINVEMDGKDLLECFLEQLRKNNIETPWKEGDEFPQNVKLQVWSEKGQKFIDFKPEHVKFVYNK